MEFTSLIPVVWGSLLGAIIGIIPGLAPAQVLGVLFVALFFLDPVQLIGFYIGMITVSQYIDSIPAIYFGVPGETSAIPAAYEGPALRSQGLGLQAIRLTAVGRIFAGAISIALCLALLPWILSSTWFFSNQAQIVMLSLALIGIFFSSQTRWAQTLVAMAMGYFIGAIGYNYLLEKNFLTFGYANLIDGVPMVCVIMGIYVIPLLISEIQKKHQALDFQDFDQGSDRPLELKSHAKNMCQSSVIGWFTGLLPGLSYVLSSTIAYNWQKKKQIRAGTYQRGNIPSVISAETSNTAGAVSTLLPLLVFGIPITGSETIIYNLMLLNGADFAKGKFFLDNWGYVTLALLISTAIGLLFCWPMSRFFGHLLSKIKLSWLWALIIIIVVASVLYVGWYNSQLEFYIISFVVMIAVGMIIRNRVDPMPVVFMFVMQASIDQAIMTFRQLYL